MKTLQEAVTAFQNGSPVLILTYHSVKAEEITYRDKQTKLAAKFNSLRHTCLTDTGAVVWQERTPLDFDVTKYSSPYKRGEKILVSVTSLQNNQGVTVISGTGEVIGEKK